MTLAQAGQPATLNERLDETSSRNECLPTGDPEGVSQPPTAAEVRAVLRRILSSGSSAAVRFTQHALDPIAEDDLTTVDCVNVLKGGLVEEAEYEHGAWRHRVRTQRTCVVIEVLSDSEIVVVTAWRTKT
jgi:hypothetical protein